MPGTDESYDEGTFDIAHWKAETQEYGLFHILMCRAFMPDKLDIPIGMEEFKSMGANEVATALAAHGEEDGDEEALISEGEPVEQTEKAVWSGKKGSWWRIYAGLREDALVREGVSLASPELRRFKPSDMVQQAGPARALVTSRGNVIRMPVMPSGWLTACAKPAGGPTYLVRASVPRWKVIYHSVDSSDGDVIVREEPALDSDEVNVLYHGDIVEQAGPPLKMLDDIWRMPICSSVRRRGSGAGDSDGEGEQNASTAKILGWVTIDASPKGGPVFFKPVKDPEEPRRRRRAKNGAA